MEDVLIEFWAGIMMFPPRKTLPSDEYAVFMPTDQSIFCPYVCTDVCIYNAT